MYQGRERHVTAPSPFRNSETSTGAGPIAVLLNHGGHELTLSVYDSAGRHVGLNESLLDQSRTELDLGIPGSNYFDFHNGTIEILLPASVGNFSVQVGGAYMQEAQESFTVTCLTFTNGALASSKTTAVSMTKGSLATAPATVQKGILSVGNFVVTLPVSTHTSSSGSGGIAEFPFQSLAIAVFTFVVVLSYVAARRRIMTP